MSAAVREFYEFHRVEGRGPQDLVLTRNPSRLPRRAHSFLAHIEQRHPSAVSRLTRPGKQPAETVQLIDFEADFATLLAAASTHRDRLLLSALYDLGLRVGQALGHGTPTWTRCASECRCAAGRTTPTGAVKAASAIRGGRAPPVLRPVRRLPPQ